MSLESLYSDNNQFLHTHSDSNESGLKKGQSAIEYLMTYGWMLLVVAVVGGAIFAVVGDQSVESVSGFSGGDVLVDDFGVTSNGNLQLILRNSAGESVEVTGIEVSENGNTAEWSNTQSVGVGSTESVTLNSVEEGQGVSTLDVEIFYDVGGLENLGVSGTISGNFEVVSDSINYGLDAGYSVNDSSPEPGDAVEFTSSSSPSSEINSYSWSSPDTSLDESSGESIVHVFGSDRSYEVNLTVSDGLGNSSSYSEVIDVSSSSGSADFQLSGVSDNGPVTEGDTVNVDYTVSNNGGVSGSQDIVLDVDGAQEDVDSSVSLSSGGSSSGTLSWSTSSGDAGSYSYTVSTENDSVSGTVDVNSLNGPTASASKNVSHPEVGETVEFDASGSTQGDGSITGYSWDVNGDGSYEKSGEVVTHSYGSSGIKNVELNVTDDNGLNNIDSLSVDVQSVSVAYDFENGDELWVGKDFSRTNSNSLNGSYSLDLIGALNSNTNERALISGKLGSNVSVNDSITIYTYGDNTDIAWGLSSSSISETGSSESLPSSSEAFRFSYQAEYDGHQVTYADGSGSYTDIHEVNAGSKNNEWIKSQITYINDSKIKINMTDSSNNVFLSDSFNPNDYTSTSSWGHIFVGAKNYGSGTGYADDILIEYNKY